MAADDGDKLMPMDLLTMAAQMAVTIAVLFVATGGIVWAIFHAADWLERKG